MEYLLWLINCFKTRTHFYDLSALYNLHYFTKKWIFIYCVIKLLINPLVILTIAARSNAHQKFLTLNPDKNQSATWIKIALSNQVKILSDKIPSVIILRNVPKVISSIPTTTATIIHEKNFSFLLLVEVSHRCKRLFLPLVYL